MTTSISEIRKDFPLLMSNDVIYLDTAATSQKPSCVLEAERTFYEKYIREEYNDFQLLTYRRICQEVLQGRFRTVELWNSRQGKIYFLCREDTGRKIVVDYSGTVCYTSKDYDVLQASMKREHVTADSILIFSENGYEKTLTEGTVQILVHSVDENS